MKHDFAHSQGLDQLLERFRRCRFGADPLSPLPALGESGDVSEGDNELVGQVDEAERGCMEVGREEEVAEVASRLWFRLRRWERWWIGEKGGD